MYAVDCIRAGVDWYSATMREEAPEAQEWRQKCTNYFREIASTGFRVVPRRLYGFDGFMAGGNYIGAKEGLIFAQFTSAEADAAYQLLDTTFANVSRIDLQVTVQFTEYQEDIGVRTYNQARIANQKLPEKRRRKVTQVMGDDGGHTTYIGSPKSEERGKVYNKEVESGEDEYLRCWRYEVVFRNEHARDARTILSKPGRTRGSLICDLVARWFVLRGCQPPWSLRDADTVLPRLREGSNDRDRILNWLGTQVRPPVQRLIAEGYGDVVYSLLFGASKALEAQSDKNPPEKE